MSGQGNIVGAPNAAKLGSKATSKPKRRTRAQELARALKACKKLKSKNKREACERRARKKYGVRHKGKSAKRTRSPAPRATRSRLR